MESDVGLILILAAILWLSPFFAKILALPTALIEILSGSILATFSLIHPNGYFDLLAKVGFLFLMFIAGMEVDLKKLLYAPKELLQKGLFFLGLIGILSIVIGKLLHLNIIYILSIPLISIGILATLSQFKNQKWLESAFIIGVLGEVVSIIVLTIFDVSVHVGFGLKLFEELAILFGFIFLIALLYKLLDLLFWWFPNLKEFLMPRSDSAKQDIRLSIALFFILIAIMLKLHLELALGAFIAGVAIKEFFHHKKNLENELMSFGFGFLVPLFFVHVGSTFDLRALFLQGVFEDALLITFLSFIIKIVSAFVFYKRFALKEIILFALSLSMPLTLLVAIATIGYDMKLISILNYFSLILAAILEVFLAMIAIKILSKRK